MLELLVVIAILAVLATISAGYFRNFARNIEVEEMSNKIASQLKDARARSMNGEGDMKWGVHFTNGASDYFELFSTPTDYSSPSKVIKETSYFSSGVVFTTPSEGISADVIFDKIYGSTTPAEITIYSESRYATTTVNSNGNIY